MTLPPPTGEQFTQRAALWRWTTASGAGLIFVRFTDPVAGEISTLALMRRLEGGHRRGWGSLKVMAEIGATRWATSIFPGNEASWLLPVKAGVRKAEGIAEGDEVDVSIEL
ncbi:MAG TPA: DUF1905 domain-containing protein [Novosphingobium sp.]|nr:DUF1905 domain-containing protein [Novosphingobium sp.]